MDLKIDQTTGDLAIENGDLVMVEGREAIRQHLQIRLRFFKGEWFLDQNAGVPYFQRVLGKGPALAVVAAVIRREIASTPGVIKLLKFSMDFDRSARTLRVDFVARTTDGVLEFSEEF